VTAASPVGSVVPNHNCTVRPVVDGAADVAVSRCLPTDAARQPSASKGLCHLREWSLMKIVLPLLAIGLVAFGQQASMDELSKLFQNDPQKPPDERIVASKGRKGVRIFDYSFSSPVSGRVPGVMVAPDRPGRFPVVLFGHWMMAGSPMRNHTEFLEEAIVFARAGAICVLLDSPLVRDGVTEDPDPMHGQGPNGTLQMTREWRRALDLLLARKDVDSKRVAYVGHSFSAGVGAKLIGVETRIQSFVLMANVYSMHDYIYDEQNAEMVSMRKKMGEEWIQNYFRQFPWDDSVTFVRHSAPRAVFLQNGRSDTPLPERIVRKSFEYFQEPKQLEFYDAGHELNATARMDRAKWLQGRLKLKSLDVKALESIPQLH
jgi:cephalosporin-C deacetylase-like acetyl esterase